MYIAMTTHLKRDVIGHLALSPANGVGYVRHFLEHV